jgi:hypothetical protein
MHDNRIARIIFPEHRSINKASNNEHAIQGTKSSDAQDGDIVEAARTSSDDAIDEPRDSTWHCSIVAAAS